MELFNTPQERFDHMQALMGVAMADCKFHEKERTYIENLCALYGLTPAEFDLEKISRKMSDPDELPRILARLAGRCNKLVLLQDLIAFSFVDG